MRFHRKLSAVCFITALLLYLPNFLLTSYAHASLAHGESSMGSSQATPGSDAPSVIYEFPDLPIPIELERVEDRTIMIKTSSYQGGILIFKGRVTIVSLIEFFTKSMSNHGWILDGTLNAKRSFLAFSKGDNAYCLIQIYNKSMGFKTEVQIWVSEPLVQ